MAKRGRKLQLTDAVVSAIHARRRAGVPYADLAREFSLGIGSISRALKMPEPVTDEVPGVRRRPRKPFVATVPAAPSVAAGAGHPDDDGPAEREGGPALLSLLERQVDALEGLAKAAKADPAAFLAINRSMNSSIALLAKLQPPPPPDHENAPDMVEAARRCREKLHELLDRAIVARSVATAATAGA